MTTIVYIPREFVELRNEIQHHPPLMEYLTETQAEGFSDIFGKIAAYCNIAMDGVYSEEDLIAIALQCVRRLQAKRCIIVSLH